MEQAMAWRVVLAAQAALPFPDTRESVELTAKAPSIEVLSYFAHPRRRRSRYRVFRVPAHGRWKEYILPDVG